MTSKIISLVVVVLLGFQSSTKADFIGGTNYIGTVIGFGSPISFGSPDQLIDGIDAETDVAPYNGLALNTTDDAIDFPLLGEFTLTGFRLSNDINVGTGGVKDFDLLFYDFNGFVIGHLQNVFTAANGTVASQLFTFAPIAGVKTVRLDVLNNHPGSPGQIRIREVSFEGSVPEPTSGALCVLGAALLAMRRRNMAR